MSDDGKKLPRDDGKKLPRDDGKKLPRDDGEKLLRDDGKKLLSAYREARTPNAAAREAHWEGLQARLAAPPTPGEGEGESESAGDAGQATGDAAARVGVGWKAAAVLLAVAGAATLATVARRGAEPHPTSEAAPDADDVPQPGEVQTSEAAPQADDVQPAEAAPQADDVRPAEAAPQADDVRAAEATPQAEAMQAAEGATRADDVQAAEAAPQADDVQAARGDEAREGKARTKTPGSTLAAEMALLSRGQAALQAGDAAGALALFEQHRRRFAAGVMAEEREVKRVAALCALGRVAQARRAAQAFVKRFPRSASREQVMRECRAP